MNWNEVGSSIPYLGFHSELSLSLKSQIREPGCTHRMEYSFFTAKVRDIQYFDFLNRWVSLKEREFTYSKFQQIINSTTIIYSIWAVVRVLKYNWITFLTLEYRTDQVWMKVGYSPKSLISLHRCAMIEKVFFRYDQWFCSNFSCMSSSTNDYSNHTHV